VAQITNDLRDVQCYAADSGQAHYVLAKLGLQIAEINSHLEPLLALSVEGHGNIYQLARQDRATIGRLHGMALSGTPLDDEQNNLLTIAKARLASIERFLNSTDRQRRYRAMVAAREFKGVAIVLNYSQLKKIYRIPDPETMDDDVLIFQDGLPLSAISQIIPYSAADERRLKELLNELQ